MRKPWSKLPGSVLTDETAIALVDGVGPLGLLMRVVMLRYALSDTGRTVQGTVSETVGWLVTEHGRALSVGMLARLASVSETEAAAIVEFMLAIGLAVRADDGETIGYVGWLATQETPDAARKRSVRQKERSAPPSPEPDSRANRRPDSPPVVHAEEKRREEKRREENSLSTTVDAAPLSLVPEEPTPDLAAEVVDLFDRTARDLGLLGPSDRTRMSAKLRKAIGQRGDSGAWGRVIARAAEELRRKAEGQGRKPTEIDAARWFDIRHLAKPDQFDRLVSATYLDQRRPGQPATTRLPPRRVVPQNNMDTDAAMRLIGEDE